MQTMEISSKKFRDTKKNKPIYEKKKSGAFLFNLYKDSNAAMNSKYSIVISNQLMFFLTGMAKLN
jgi:hypothetical protein